MIDLKLAKMELEKRGWVDVTIQDDVVGQLEFTRDPSDEHSLSIDLDNNHAFLITPFWDEELGEWNGDTENFETLEELLNRII